ncbi:MAG: hypothetical protein ACJAWL_001932 [Motiliproteus sp.]|jgi:hypothetical protein
MLVFWRWVALFMAKKTTQQRNRPDNWARQRILAVLVVT